jgi:hypothetical protein
VPRVVQREIDRHKDGGNARRASRARKAWALFAQVIDSDDNRLTKEVGNYNISLELLMPKISAYDFPYLDLQNPDDQIVAEALWVRRHRPDDSLTFLSNDTPALTTAKSQKLPFLRLPEQWMLQPEKDERDRMIEELRKQVQVLSSQKPELAFVLPDVPDNRVSTEITLFPELGVTDISTLMDEIQAQFPMEKSFPEEPPARKEGTLFELAALMTSRFEQWEPADAKDIVHYQKKSYPEWLRQIEFELKDIHQRLNVDLFSTVTLVLENQGQQPARSVLISVQAEGAIIFGAPPKKGDGDKPDSARSLITAPPTPPSGKYVNLADRFMNMTAVPDYFGRGNGPAIPDFTTMLADHRHDPNVFYWKLARPTGETTEWELECDEFRHQHEPYQLKIPLRPNPVSEGNISGVIRCKAHASNLPNVVELLVPVRIRVARGDTLSQIRSELYRMR